MSEVEQNPWRNDVLLSKRLLPDYPDELQVIVHAAPEFTCRGLRRIPTPRQQFSSTVILNQVGIIFDLGLGNLYVRF